MYESLHGAIGLHRQGHIIECFKIRGGLENIAPGKAVCITKDGEG